MPQHAGQFFSPGPILLHRRAGASRNCLPTLSWDGLHTLLFRCRSIHAHFRSLLEVGGSLAFESIERHATIDRGNDVLRAQEMPIEIRDIVISAREADVRDRLGRVCEKVACLRNSDLVDKINEILTAVLLEESREC